MVIRKNYSGNAIVKVILSLCVIGAVLFILHSALFVSMSHDAEERAITVNCLKFIERALQNYRAHYGYYPTGIKNHKLLIRVLRGENVAGKNPDRLCYFDQRASLIPAERLFKDGYGNDFILVNCKDGTNLIIRSIMSGGRYDEYSKDSRVRFECNTALLDETIPGG